MNASTPNTLQLLLSHADTGLPAIPDGLPDSGGPETSKSGELPVVLGRDDDHPQDLEHQRWGVVIPQGHRGERLLELVKPLMDRRAEQQGAEVRVTRVKPALDFDGAVAWKGRHWQPERDDGLDIPGYRLILGDLHEVPLIAQQLLAMDGFTGRLAFDRDEDYTNYVQKLLRWEDQATLAQRGEAVLFSALDGSAAPADGHKQLVAPTLQRLQRDLEYGRLKAETVRSGGGYDARPGDLTDLIGQATRPAVLFSLSHGDGAPEQGWSSAADARAWQGAMRFMPGRRLGADDLPATPFLPGGIWFMFACYGAGTPAVSAYRPWLDKVLPPDEHQRFLPVLDAALPRDGEPPFIAALPKRLLADMEGPVAFVGHVDLAWSYSYEELDSNGFTRAGRFLGALRMMIEGSRVGVGLRKLQAGSQDLDQILIHALQGNYIDGVSPPDAIGHVGMAKEDLRSYILLGDPAARLPIR